jgi:hypothetical protein
VQQSSSVLDPTDLPTTPRGISNEITSFCEELVPGGVPAIVDVRPSKFAAPNLCFDNVEDVVQLIGGSGQFGWVIWEESLLLQAVFHAVWVSATGRYVDVTPHEFGETRILFLPDPARVHKQDESISNEYWPRIDHPAVHSLIDSFKREFELTQIHGTVPGFNNLPVEARAELKADRDAIAPQLAKLIEQSGEPAGPIPEPNISSK